MPKALKNLQQIPYLHFHTAAKQGTAKQRKFDSLKKELRKSSAVFNQLRGKRHFSPKPPFPLVWEGKTFPGRVCPVAGLLDCLGRPGLCAKSRMRSGSLPEGPPEVSADVATSLCRAPPSPVCAELGLVSVVRSRRFSDTAGADLGSCRLQWGPGTGLWGWTPAPRGVC